MTEKFLNYGRQTVEDDDIAAVAAVLRGDWLTTGPNVRQFEADLEAYTGAGHAVAVNSGTAALHAAYAALGVGPGDEVIVPALTFSATANAARYLGATVKFADVDETLTMDPSSTRKLVTDRTKVITAVDYAGHPADYDQLRKVAEAAGAALVGDGCHALGAAYRGRRVGSVADVTCFSFHPVKHVTTGEGGACTTNDAELAEKMSLFRTHGIVRDVTEVAGEPVGGWGYDIFELGYNYRITDFQCALGSSQLRKLDGWVERRRAIAARYREGFEGLDGVAVLPEAAWAHHAYHLFPIRVAAARRHEIFDGLRERRIGVQVHYIPVNALGAYRSAGYDPADTPRTLEAYRELISLPMYPTLEDADVDRVVREVRELL